jgi:RNA recognition motif-containing protein
MDSLFYHPAYLWRFEMNIYVGNLAFNVTADDLKEAFSAFGKVESANIISDKFTGQSKGFGFVEMPDNSDADKAMKALNGQNLKGRNIKVNQAKPKSDRPKRRPRY